MPRLLRSAVGWWAGLLLVYLLLASSPQGAEVLAGVVLAAVAAVAVVATRRAGRLEYRPRLRWLRVLGRLLGRVLTDCAVVTAALGRAMIGRKVEGAFRTVPFDPGGDDPESAARRALVTAGACLAANTYVVAVDVRRGLLVVHQLVPSPEPPGRGDREWPL